MNDTEKKKWKRVSMIFNEDILAMIERFMSEKGFDTTSEVVKQAIRGMYTKEFPAYVEAKRQGPVTPEEKAQYEQDKKEAKIKLEEKRLMGICEALGGKVEKGESGNMVCKYFQYDKNNRYENELPIAFLSEDLLESQYSPSKEDVERRQKAGKVNYKL